MTIRSIQWDADAWDEYCDWQQTNKNIVKRINQLVRDIRRMPFDGIGKPEALKENLSGFWSRRINEEHRIVYAVADDAVIIISCKGHYED